MLLKSITILSMILAVLECLGNVWMIPLAFVGNFLGLAVLAFLFLVAVSYMVDQNKEQENDDPFYRWVIAVYVEVLIQLLQARVTATGLEKTPKEGRFLLVCNHQFLADPGILLHHFRDSQLAFISKQENRDMFCVGPLMHKILCQTLDRDNDRQALKVILKCIQIIKEDKASIAVFPEGGTNHDNHLYPFRPGAFKIAEKCKVPIVVCTLRNTPTVFHNMAHLKPCDVDLHLLTVIQPEEYEGISTVELANRIHDIMAEDIGYDGVFHGTENT